jgi:hypothetical protein
MQPLTHIRRTERTALMRNWHVTDRWESTFKALYQHLCGKYEEAKYEAEVSIDGDDG